MCRLVFLLSCSKWFSSFLTWSRCLWGVEGVIILSPMWLHGRQGESGSALLSHPQGLLPCFPASIFSLTILSGWEVQGLFFQMLQTVRSRASSSTLMSLGSVLPPTTGGRMEEIISPLANSTKWQMRHWSRSLTYVHRVGSPATPSKGSALLCCPGWWSWCGGRSSLLCFIK